MDEYICFMHSNAFRRRIYKTVDRNLRGWLYLPNRSDSAHIDIAANRVGKYD